MGGVDDVLINLVSYDIGVVFLRQGGNDRQLLPGEDPPAGVGGVAENQGLGFLAEGVLQDLRVKAEVRRRQGHVDGLRAAEDGVRPVVLVEGREDRHLVPGVRHRHHGGHHGLRAAAGDGNLAVGADGEAHVPGLLCRQGLPEVLGPPGDRILVEVLLADLCQPVQDSPGRLKVREALGEVHRAVLIRNAGHAADYRVGKTGGALRQALHGRALQCRIFGRSGCAGDPGHP